MAKQAKKAVKPARRKPTKARANAAPGKTATTARLSASIETSLLAEAERYAKARRTTVGELVTEGLRKVIGAAKTPVLPPGDLASQPAADGGPWGQLLAWMEEQQAALTEIRDALGEVAASLPADNAPGENRPTPGPRIPPV